ncbi:MAG: hypothetical protein ACYS19_20305, partial [Planctomycetota bacterium]
GIIFNGLASKPSKAYLLADPERKMLTVERDAKKNLTTVRVPHEAPDSNDSVIVLEFDSPVRIDETAKGRYHWVKGTGLEGRNKTKKK